MNDMIIQPVLFPLLLQLGGDDMDSVSPRPAQLSEKEKVSLMPDIGRSTSVALLNRYYAIKNKKQVFGNMCKALIALLCLIGGDSRTPGVSGVL